MIVDQAFVNEIFGPVLARLRSDSQKYFDTPEAALEPLDCISRPFSDVLRIRIKSGTDSQFAFIKIFKLQDKSEAHVERIRNRLLRDFASTRRIYESFGGHANLASVRPIACFPEYFALVTEEIAGVTLDEVIRQKLRFPARADSLRELGETFERLGAWVKTFQAANRTGKQVSLEGVRAYIDERLVKMVGRGRLEFTEADRAGVLRFLDAKFPEIAATELSEVNIHADLNPENVIVNGDRVTLLDFTMAKTGTVHHDLSHMFMYLGIVKRKFIFRGAEIDRLQKAMLSGYDAALNPTQPLFQLLLLQHVVCHFASMPENPAPSPTRLYHWYLWRPYRRWLGQLATTFR
jgi:tRNA A-37 threonylcarbamoyl transferase component Bud32